MEFGRGIYLEKKNNKSNTVDAKSFEPKFWVLKGHLKIPNMNLYKTQNVDKGQWDGRILSAVPWDPHLGLSFRE